MGRRLFPTVTAYGTAHNEVHGTDIKSGTILMCSKDYEFQTWTIEGAEWDKWQERWFNRVEQYYKLV